MSTDKIDLTKIFKLIENKQYSIIKLPNEFPSYDIGSDLDIFCYNIDDLSKNIIATLQQYVSADINIEIQKRDSQMYIDILDDGGIHLRFDLYEQLPVYKQVNIKKGFFSSIIENSQIVSFDSFKVKIPSQIDEVILRYIEYHEWYVKRPDKIKHINYIIEKVDNNEISQDKFLDKLHYYISIPKFSEERKVSKFQFLRYIKYLFSFFYKIIGLLNELGFKKTFKLIFNKLKS